MCSWAFATLESAAWATFRQADTIVVFPQPRGIDQRAEGAVVQKVERPSNTQQGRTGSESGNIAPSEVDRASTPVVSILLSDGQWVTATLDNIKNDVWSVLPRKSGNTETRTFEAAQIAAFVVRRQGLRPAVGSDAEINRRGEGSLLRVTPLSLGVIDSVDGERIPGTFRVVNGSAVWDHRWIGAIPIDLERISGLRMIADRRAPQTQDADTVLLLNGDVVRGFVDEITEDISLSPLSETEERTQSTQAPAQQPGSRDSDSNQPPTDDGKPSEKASTEPTKAVRVIPMDRVAAIALAAMPAETRGGLEVWTSDGSLVSARDLTFQRNTGWSFQLASDWLSKARSKPTTDNSAADPIAGVLNSQKLLPLAACSLDEITKRDKTFLYGTQDLVKVARQEQFLLGCADISIDGPCAMRLHIPESMAREGMVLSGVVSILEPAPADVRLELSIGFENGERESLVLDGATRTRSFIVTSKSGVPRALTIELTDGGNGVVGDRVVLERAVLISPR